MAEVDVKKKPSQEIERSQSGTGVTRWRDYPNSPWFDFPGGELFSMRPSLLLRRISDEMDRMFASMSPQRGAEFGREGSWWPAIEVSQGGGQLSVCADIPGIKPEDVKVEIDDNDLVIRGERKQEQTERRQGHYRSERSYGEFYRRIPLPEGANPEEAKADFVNGELRVSIPVTEPERRRREIKIGSRETKK